MTLRQADQRWSTLQLGIGTSTIGRAGCLLVCLTESARLLAGRPDLLPPHANEQLRQAGAFVGSMLNVEIAARALGLESPHGDRVVAETGSPDMADAVERALGGGHAVVHVDHDSNAEDGDPEGDHFLLAVGFQRSNGSPLHVECYDSATGTPVWLDWPDLVGQARWGKRVKTYRAVSVRPLRART